MRSDMKKTIVLLLCAVAFALAFTGCVDSNSNAPTNAGTNTPGVLSETNTPGIDKLKTVTDYAEQGNWLALPSSNDKSVDVLYFYPTVYSRTNDSEDAIADIDNTIMREQAQSVLGFQATAFADSCNIYAPYYRQVDAQHALTLSNEDNNELLRYLASTDPAAALDYYFENLNDGRPFILAGHSQGSEVLTMLLSDYMKQHPDYYKNMVAAYVIGYSVTHKYLDENSHLKFATGSSDTGVIVSYNTEGPGNTNAHNAVVLDGALSINPLSWTLSDDYAGVELNKGSLLPDGTVGAGFADAQVDTERGGVVCSTVDPAVYGMPEQMVSLFGAESYHGSDYTFYYRNLQENVALRIATFKAS